MCGNGIGSITHASSLSRRLAPELVQEITALLKQRAQGRPGAGRARGPRAKKNARGGYHRSGRTRPALPARWCYGLYAISLGTGCLAPIIRGAKAQRREFGISTGMPGPRDFTVASEPFVRMIRSRCDQTRPPHPAPDVRDDREAPLRVRRDAGIKSRFPKNSNRNIFARRSGQPTRIESAREIRRSAQAIFPPSGRPRKPACDGG